MYNAPGEMLKLSHRRILFLNGAFSLIYNMPLCVSDWYAGIICFRLVII